MPIPAAIAPTATSAATATAEPAVTPAPEATDESTPEPDDGTTAAASGDLSVTPIMRKLKLTGEHYATLGDPKAPLTVIEFSDYGCPFCRRYVSTTFDKLKAAYIDTGKVYYVYKDF